MFEVQNLINRINALCCEKNITVNKLATLSGLTQSTIDSILKGKSVNPRVETIDKIADVFGVSIDYLLGLSDDRKRR